MTDVSSLAGRVVIVTGGGYGIGRGIVDVLAKDGARVVVAEKDPSYGGALEATLAACDGLFVETDVSCPDSIAALFWAVDTRYGRLDGLINNAGLTIQGDFASFSLKDCDLLYQTNLRSVFLCSQHAAARMEKAGQGAIVNISSNHARASVAGFEMYAAMKGGIVAMSRAMALSLAPKGIRVNSLSPGYTLNKGLEAAIDQNPALLDTINALHPAGRFNQPEDVGRIAAFLLSDAAIGIVGADILADNGMSALLFKRNS